MKNSPRFITTAELGRLARWLRLLGYDCVFFERDKKKDLVIENLREDRVILTRDPGLSRFRGARMVRVESDLVERQLEQVIDALRLKIDKKGMFTRCVLCNELTEGVAKEIVKERVPQYVYGTQDEFMLCPGCGKVYWKGTHRDLANKFLSGINTGGGGRRKRL